MLDGLVPRSKWPKTDALVELMETAAIAGGATPLESRVIDLPCEKSRPDSPPGGTAWCGLDESHITLHWYYKDDQVEFAADVFTCGDNAHADVIMEALLAPMGVNPRFFWHFRGRMQLPFEFTEQQPSLHLVK